MAPARVLRWTAPFLLLAVLPPASPVRAQQRVASSSTGLAGRFAAPAPVRIGPAADGAAGAGAVGSVLTTPGGAFGASLLLPGAGQAALGLRRWVVYGAIEAGLWVVYLDARHDFARFTDRYRDLAWEVAREPGTEPRRDGGWGYYEAMSHYGASGAFDADPDQPGVQPEMDPATYNGAVWDIARGLYLPDGVANPSSPAYTAAIGYYVDRAAGPGFLWSWAGRDGDLREFRRLIDAADDESRAETGALGLILANHLVSAIDALIVARLRGDTGAELRSDLIRSVAGPRLRVSLHIPLEP